MAKLRKAAASKAKSAARKKTAAKSAVRARAEKRASSKARPAAKPKQQKVKLKAHRAKQPAAKAAAKAKPKVAPKPAPSKPQNKAVNKKEQRLAKFKAVAKRALERVQAAAGKTDNTQPKNGGAPLAAVVAKKGTRGLTAREKALVKEFERRELSPADAEARRIRLKNLIVLGKERTYLTYSEINDHLPDDMMDAEQIENIIGMINDMGIQVYDEAPDAETLLMSDVTPAVTDEAAVEEAEAALSTVDSEFGRTTDPVRMYMREMGSVEIGRASCRERV